MLNSVPSQKTHESVMFFKIHFMPYLLSANRFFYVIVTEITKVHFLSWLNTRKNTITQFFQYVLGITTYFFPSNILEKRYNPTFLIRENDVSYSHKCTQSKWKSFSKTWTLFGLVTMVIDILFRLAFISIHKCSVVFNFICLDLRLYWP